MTANLAARIAQQLDQSVGWARLPRVVGLPVLIGLRHQLRTSNLYAAEPVPVPPTRPVDVGNYLAARTRDGSYNDLRDPRMGAVGCRFGRNVPPEHAYPESDRRLLDPNPRLISRTLLTREQFEPATSLNLLAAAWIQFEVHDWFAHGTVPTTPWTVPLHDDDPWPERPMRVERTPPDPHPARVGPPTFTTRESHWWDASQIYGTTPEFARALRAPEQGKLRIDDVGLPPREVEALADLTGPAGNFWVGLALLHSLFMREHNAICDHLALTYPHLTGQQLYDKARLVNSALMAKIHTVDWTPAIIAHPTTMTAMRINWSGLLGQRPAPRTGWISRSPLLFGIPGSRTTHHGVPYSLTEEFVAVYRMHPLIPDEFTFRALADDRVTARHELPELSVANVRARLAESPMADLLYSFGRAHPGAISLHNFPQHLQHMHRFDGTLMDLATIDVIRSRERGVPRYNEFRRLFRLKPAASFEELTGETALAAELREIYGDVELVDLMIGLYAEPKPPGFGFSDTAFRVFILMATRRLESDRFFTTDFRDEVYTPAGMTWIRENTMRTVLLRHFPELEPALAGVANPFAPWTATSMPAPNPRSDQKGTRMTETVAPADVRRITESLDPVRYRPDLEQPKPGEARDIEKIIKCLHKNNERAYKKFKHGLRDAHAKSHAILRGELIVNPDLPEMLAQGMFAEARSYPVIARISTTSGVLRSDKNRGVRGLGIKVIGVHGERAMKDPKDDENVTQDFVLVTHEQFLFADAHAYRRLGMLSATLLARLSDRALWVGSELLAGLQKVGVDLPDNLKVFVARNRPILGETFFSSAPIRYGDYVVRFKYEPASPEVKSLADQDLPRNPGQDEHRDLIMRFFEKHSAEYTLSVQLCLDTEEMPIEDATQPWKSPYLPVAKVVFPEQNPYSALRRAYGDDVLSFNSWRGLEAHRPLGSINRLKRTVYEASSNFRHDKNQIERHEPADIAELPD